MTMNDHDEWRRRRRAQGWKSALRTTAVASFLGVSTYSLFSEEPYLRNGRARALSADVPIAAAAANPLPNDYSTETTPKNVYADEEVNHDISNFALLPWAQNNLVDIHQGPLQTDATALFWHIPKAGGTAAKQLYQCMGLTLSIRIGVDPRFGHDQSNHIVTFQPIQGEDWKTVNVDTIVRPGISRAKELGLVQSHTTDLIFTMEPAFAGEQLFDAKDKGRILALFRHPIDRLVSKFYYLQTATWEQTYKPEWRDMSIVDWAELPSADENFMVRQLSGKIFSDPVDEMDLIQAKEFLRQRVVVGLIGEMGESIRRFNIALGVDERVERNQRCMEKYFEGKEGDAEVKNSNKHPKVAEGTPEWRALAQKNDLDMNLYAYVEKLFDEQKAIIDSYVATVGEETSESIEAY